MARTITINKGGGSSYEAGWKTATISRAAFGVYNDAKYLDVWFNGYPDNFNARIYEKISNGEEWAVGQVFRFANAGITSALEGTNGKMIIKMDDNPALLAGKEVNIYLYKDGKYSRILKQFAPTVFENAAEKFTDDDVIYWKTKAHKFYTEFAETGALSENSYTELAKQGLDKTLVDSYIEGQKLVADTNTKSIQDVAGGKERYSELVEWAGKNLSEAEQKVFNDMVDSGDVETAKFAVQGLMSKANVNYNPNQPDLFEGTSDIISADAFTSVSQVTDAMNDPRYEKDPTFRKEVENKLSRSKVI